MSPGASLARDQAQLRETREIGLRVPAYPNAQGGYVGQQPARQVASSQTYGSGCPTATPLALDAASGYTPVLGSNLPLELSSIPAGSPLGALLFGLTTQTIDLGSPGCFQLTSNDASIPFSVTASLTTASYLVPQSPVFAGAVLKVQGAALRVGINALNVATSNGVLLTLGEL